MAVDMPVLDGDSGEQSSPDLTTNYKERLNTKSVRKIKALLIVCFVCFCLIGAKLFLIQITYGDLYRDIARKQYESKVLLAAERGNIFDRKGRLVATTVQKLSIAADPRILKKPGNLVQLLSSVTGKPREYYLKKIHETHSSFVWLERTIDAPSLILTSQLDSIHDDGIITLREPRRSFAYGMLASQILGFTDAENKGASGLELGYDSVLKGRAGYMIMQRDGRGNRRPSPDLPQKEPQTGKSLILTLDMDMQSIVESELSQGVQKAEAESGMVIVLKPSTGEILAMASHPTFNPNQLSGATPDLTRNRSFTDMYEPGSTFKLITAAALLDEDKIEPGTMVDGSPTTQRVILPDDHPVGKATFARALELSSNIVMTSTITRISNAKFYKYVRDFGFGIYSGIDAPGEVRGMVKKPHEFDGSTKLYMATGYQLAVTPLQIVNAYATVANKGMMMKPYLVQKVVNDKGETVQNFEPQKIRRVVSEQTAEQLAEIFRGVVERGTGQSAHIQGLEIAGKTGTAQKLRDGKYSKEDYTASFAGFFPARNPEVAVVVMLHKPRKGYYGGQVAAPIFQKIAQQFVATGLVSTGQIPTTTTPKATEKQSPEPEVEITTLITPDFRGMQYQSALDLALSKGLTIKTSSPGGVVQEQKPRAGVTIKAGSVIMLTTMQPDITVDALPNTTIPNVRGMTLRRALTLLHAANIKTKVLGQGGIVYKQEFKDGKEPLCILDCRKPETNK